MTKKHHDKAHVTENIEDIEPGVDNQSSEISNLEMELKEAQDKMLRALAEADNARKRTKIEVENAHKYSIEKFARELLHVVDTMEKGLEAADSIEHSSAESMKQGIELTHKMLLTTLEKFHIKQIDPVGAEFDPVQHEALTAQPTDEYEPNKVINVVQKGYTIYDRVLRPARVIVAKALEN